MKRLSPFEIQRMENLLYNQKQNYSHITNEYLVEKLDAGLIKYEPSLWAEAQLSPIDENGSR